MAALWHRCSRHRLLIATVLCGTLLFLSLVSIVDRWAPRNVQRRKPKRVNDPSFQEIGQPLNERQWESEYESRVQRVRDVCEKDEIAAMRRVWRVAANRRFGKETHCKTRLCPIIIDEPKVLFFCFIPKVASTLVKRFFLNISDVHLNETVRNNDTALHSVANDVLRRISPMYYPASTVHRFFKIIFVRHPFDRLVSAFRSKAEPPREQVRYFYDRYWDPILKKLRSNDTNSQQITFSEFVWYLTHVAERDFDEHWSPYWSRCDPCLVDYDFIGKLESAEHDFEYAFDKVGIDSGSGWWRDAHRIPRSITLGYFESVPQELVRKLYQIYRLDFELFGYSVDEFLHSKT